MTSLSQREFADLVRKAYRQLPRRVRQTLDNVDISVQDWPDPEDLDLIDAEGTLFGLYTGIPLTDREGVGPVLPDRIVIFRRPILDHCSSLKEVAEEIRVTLLHEVGHYLGLSEDALHRLGYG